MKCTRMITIVATVAAAILMIAAPVMAQVTYTFNPTVGCENWDDADHWTPNTGPPGATDKAIILDGDIVHVDTLIASGGDEVGELDVQGDGQVVIKWNCRLTLHAEDTSTVEGLIIFRRIEGGEPRGELKIDGDVTVNGVNGTGVIAGARNGFVTPQFCWTLGPGRVFGTAGSSLTIGDELQMLGTLDIEVELINNGTVGIDTEWGSGAHTMRLMTNDKSGTGDWFTEYGEIIVSVDVDTSGKWTVNQATGGILAEIQLDHALNVTGDLTVDGGLLDVNETFCTTGKITFTQSGQVSKIDVAASTRFFANKATCP